MIERLARALQLEPHEVRRALALAAIVFALTCAYTLVKTARDALFLARLPASKLPVVFLLVGVLTTISAAVFERVTRRHSTSSALQAAAWTTAASLAGFAWLFRFGEWVPMAFYVWVNVYGLILMSQFWMHASSVSDPREAKRTFGLIGTGAILGGLAGGVAAPGLTALVGLTGLTIAAAAVTAIAAPAVRLAARAPGAATPEPDDDDVPAPRPLAHPYVRWLAAASLCSVLVTTLLDYQFKVEIQARDASPEGLATFLGLFYTATNLAALTIQLFLSRWLLQHVGAGWSASILPAGLGALSAFTLVIPGFASVVTTRLWDQVIRLSVNKTAVQLFYFPLSPGVRRRARALIDSGIERMGDALAGLLLLGLGALAITGTWAMALVVCVLVVVWVGAWLGVRRGYVVELGRNLRRMNLVAHEDGVSLRESHMIQEMERMLQSPFERVVLRALELLQENAPARIERHVPALVTHASAEVRARAVDLAAQLELTGVDAIVTAAMHDPDPAVRVAAMRARARGEVDVFDALEPYLEDPDPVLRHGALYSIAATASVRHEGALRAVISRWLRDGDPADRAAVAEALGGRPSESGLFDFFPPLLDDPVLEVRNAALRAAGRARRRTLIPLMIERLEDRRMREAARAALVAFGDHVVGTLADYLCDASVPIAVRRELPRTLGEIGSREAVAALFRCRDRSDVRLAYRLLKAANHIRQRDPSMRFPEPLVTEDIAWDVRGYLFALVHYRACPIGSTRTAERLLCIALNERMDQSLNRVFRRLALLYPAQEIHASYRGVLSEDPRARGNAIEYLENALGTAHAALVMPLVAGAGDEALLKLAGERYGMHFEGYVESLEAILQGDDPWLRTCALFVAGRQRDARLRPLVEDNLSNRDPLVRETAAWALQAAAPA